MINKKKLIENIVNLPPINQNTEIDQKKTLAENWFVNLRDQICKDFTKIEYNFKINNNNSEKVSNEIEKALSYQYKKNTISILKKLNIESFIFENF